MHINKVLDYYYRAYNKAAIGQESGRTAINAFKSVIKADKRSEFYERFKRFVLPLICGPFYWPNTFPTAIDEAAAGLLYNLVRLTRPEIAVEIGTAKGNSAIAIAQALEDNKIGKLYTIDPIEQALVKIAIRKSGLSNRINYIIDYSTKIIPKLGFKKIDFTFIDGWHDYENVLADFNLVKDLVPKGGIIVFHDTILFEGAKRVIEQIQLLGQYEIITLPTLSGGKVNDLYKSDKNFIPDGFLVGQVDDFLPVGISICRKL